VGWRADKMNDHINNQKKIRLKKFSVVLISLILLFSVPAHNPAFAVDLSFDSQINLSSNDGNSITPQVTISGSNVYVIWRDLTSGNEIFIKRSTDDGQNFAFPTTPADGVLSGAGTPSGVKLAVAGSNVYVVWKQSNEIFIAISTDSGVTFGGATNISNTGATSKDPQVGAVGTNVYVVWQEGSDVLLKRSTDSGQNFVFPTTPSDGDLGDTGGATAKPQIAISGTSVYVVWRENVSGSGDIKLSRSTDSGVNFASPTTPADGNLSSNTGASITPQIAASGSNVYVVWRDDTPAGGDKDILFKASDDNGATFGSAKNLSENSGESTTPQIAASGNRAFVVWDDNTPDAGNDGDILFITGTTVTTSITFEAPQQFKTTQTVDLTIVDAASNTNSGSIQTISATITSVTDTNEGGSGIAIDLTETGDDTGNFVGSVTFTEGETSDSTDTLKVVAGDTVTATFGAFTGTATIFPITIEFLLESSGSPFNGFDYGDIVNIRVTDKNSNIDSGTAETISVNVKSNRDSTGISLSLTETGPNTDIFGGPSVRLIFMDKNPNDPLFPTSGTVIVSSIGNSNAPPITASITSPTDTNNGGSGITLTLSETGEGTTDFTATLTLSPTTSAEESTIQVAGGDIVKITISSFTSNALVAPHSNTIGAISVNPRGNVVVIDTVTATYKVTTKNIEVKITAGEGGGGGGLVRPGLVVNALAGISIFGGSGKGVAQPTFGDVQMTSLEVNSDGLGGIIETKENSLEHTNVVNTGDTQVFRFDLYENGGINNLEHVAVYLNIRGEDFAIEDSDTFLIWEKSKPLEVNDPHGFFADVDFNVLQGDDAFNLVLNLEVIFAKPMETSHIVLKTWDLDRWSGDLELVDALTVVDPGILETEESTTEESTPEAVLTESETQHIPVWVRNNANWWSENQIDDSDFVAGMQYLIDKKIMKIPETQVASESSGEISMPDWIKNNAGWWAEGQITDDDFVTGMQWLVANGIMRV